MTLQHRITKPSKKPKSPFLFCHKGYLQAIGRSNHPSLIFSIIGILIHREVETVGCNQPLFHGSDPVKCRPLRQGHEGNKIRRLIINLTFCFFHEAMPHVLALARSYNMTFQLPCEYFYPRFLMKLCTNTRVSCIVHIFPIYNVLHLLIGTT